MGVALSLWAPAVVAVVVMVGLLLSTFCRALRHEATSKQRAPRRAKDRKTVGVMRAQWYANTERKLHTLFAANRTCSKSEHLGALSGRRWRGLPATGEAGLQKGFVGGERVPDGDRHHGTQSGGVVDEPLIGRSANHHIVRVLILHHHAF